MADSFVTHARLKAGLSPPTSRRWVTRVSLGQRPRYVADRLKDPPRGASTTPGSGKQDSKQVRDRHETVAQSAVCNIPEGDAPQGARYEALTGLFGVPKLAVFVLDKRCRTNPTAHGFPRGYCMRTKSVRVFKTGDMVRAEVPKDKQAGIHVGRVAVRASGSFRVGNADGINA